MEKIQKVGVTAFVFHEGKVLILERSQKEKFLPGYWEMPGGKVEFGEDINEAVAREVEEETNLNIVVIGPYSAFSYVSDEGRRHTVDIQYIAKVNCDIENLKISDAHSGAKWISENELQDFKISESMKEVMLKGFRAMK